MKNFFIGIFAFVLLTLSTVVLAQGGNTEPANCFDYYTFGSVYASLQTENFNNTSGTKINFSGEIKNENSYPVADGKLFVKVTRKNDNYAKNHGQDEIDSFVVKEGISIPAKGSIPLNFSWQIPAYAISGQYQLSTYYLIDDSFNMNGLTFTSDVKGEGVYFDVSGEQTTSVYFDRTNMELNGGSYLPISFTQSIPATSTANISMSLKNETDQTQRVPVTLELYEWDSQAKKNLLKKEESVYIIDANKSVTIPYEVTDTSHSVYYLLAKGQYRDTKSEVAVRFSRIGVEEPRINFSTITEYPISKGKENLLVTCVHNTNDDDIEYGKVVTTILDHEGNQIHQSQYEGKITSAIQGIVSKFKPKADYKNLTINTKIYDKEDKVLDESSVEYKCSDLSDNCEEPNLFFQIEMLIFLTALIVLVILVLFIRKRFGNASQMSLIVLFFGLSFIISPNITEAKGASPQWTYALPTSRWVTSDWMLFDGLSFMEGGPVMYNLSFNTKYYATVDNLTTGQTNLSDNVLVKPGDELRFNFGPSTNEWFRYASTVDTPPGEWESNAGPKVSCDFNNYYVDTVWGNTHAPETALTSALFSNFSVNPPTKTLTGVSDNLTCGSYVEVDDSNPETDKGYIDCIVNAVSATTTINPVFNFSETYGKIYNTLGVPFDKDRCTYHKDGDITTYTQQGFTTIQKWVGDGYDCEEPTDNGWVRADADWYCWSDENPDTSITTRIRTESLQGKTWTITYGPPNFELPVAYWSVYSWTDSGDEGSWYDNEPIDNVWDEDAKVAFKKLFTPLENTAAKKNWWEGSVTKSEPFVQNVPAKTITYTFRIQPSVACTEQNTPVKPTVTGPASGIINTNYNFSITPNSPTTSYQIDWGGGSGWQLVSDPNTIPKTWTATGTKTVKVKATDKTSLCSIESDIKQIEIADPTNGSCGTTNNSCTSGTSLDTTDSATQYLWSCNGTNGGTNASCSLNKPINGVCGSAHNQTYPSTRTAYTPDTQCASGNPSNTTFPAVGASVTWTCSGTYGGNPSTCVASRAPQATDYCNNIEDIQTTVPAGLIRTAGDCVCGV